jgi:hypothetical protein
MLDKLLYLYTNNGVKWHEESKRTNLMAKLDITIPHQLSKEEALARIKTLLDKVKKEQGDQIRDLKEDWQGEKGNFQFTAMGFDLSGMIEVNDSNVSIDGKLPLALSLFKGRIENLITEKATELLS